MSEPPFRTPEPDPVRVIRHSPLALRLRWRLGDVRRLLDEHSFWARGRSLGDLRRMLGGSEALVSAWRGGTLVGFGRGTSDGVFRAVLWDVVVAGDFQGQGLGRRIVESLLQCAPIQRAERVYLMTTNSAGFYRKLGFATSHGQHLLVLHRPSRQGGRNVSG